MKKILFLLVVLLPLVADAQKAVVESYIKSLNNYCRASYDRRGSETMIESLFTYYQDDEEQWAKMNDEITRKVLELCYDRKIDTQRPCNVFSSDIEAPAYMQCFKWLGITQATIVSMNETRKSDFQCVTAIITYSGGVYANGHTMGQDFVISNGKIYRIDNNKFAYDQWRNGGFKSDNGGNKPSQNVSQRQDNKPSTVTNNNSSVATHEYVDLGLPSGTLWATCNVGASSPEDYGDYFAWGETEPYYASGGNTKNPVWKSGKSKGYDWSSYKYANGACNKLTKYCNKSSYGNNGYTDRDTVLKPSDDAATANWGSDWCMPTKAQFQELKDKCKWTWTKKDGYKVKGPNGNTIFLRAAGYRYGTSLVVGHLYGYYWCSSLNTPSPYGGHFFCFCDSCVFGSNGWDSRWYGFSVRPVRCK